MTLAHAFTHSTHKPTITPFDPACSTECRRHGRTEDATPRDIDARQRTAGRDVVLPRTPPSRPVLVVQFPGFCLFQHD